MSTGEQGQSNEALGGKVGRRGGTSSKNQLGQADALQMPNRPLKRGENLLDLWDRTQARKDRKKARQKPVEVDLGALIGP